MTIDDSDTICSLSDELRGTPHEMLGKRIKELSEYDEFLISDCLRFINLKMGNTKKFWDWQESNGSEYAGIRRYDKIIVNTRYQCGVEVPN